MRFAALLLIGMATVASAAAQTGPARVAFLPMPNTLPTLLFAPDPLAGTLLRPLTEPRRCDRACRGAARAGGAREPDDTVALAVAQAEDPAPSPEPAPEPAAEPAGPGGDRGA